MFFFFILCVKLCHITLKNKYPKKQELQNLANLYGENNLRIQNWFRAQRRKEFIQGSLNHDVNKMELFF